MSTRITRIENEYACLWFYPEEGIIHHQFLQPISGDAFQFVLMSGLRLMQEHGATKWLSDDRKNANLPPEDGAWSEEYWLPRAVKAGWKYWALLPPTRARGRINIERLSGNVRDQRSVTIEIFSDPDKAWHWLVSQG